MAFSKRDKNRRKSAQWEQLVVVQIMCALKPNCRHPKRTQQQMRWLCSTVNARHRREYRVTYVLHRLHTGTDSVTPPCPAPPPPIIMVSSTTNLPYTNLLEKFLTLRLADKTFYVGFSFQEEEMSNPISKPQEVAAGSRSSFPFRQERWQLQRSHAPGIQWWNFPYGQKFHLTGISDSSWEYPRVYPTSSIIR